MLGKKGTLRKKQFRRKSKKNLKRKSKKNLRNNTRRGGQRVETGGVGNKSFLQGMVDGQKKVGWVEEELQLRRRPEYCDQ